MIMYTASESKQPAEPEQAFNMSLAQMSENGAAGQPIAGKKEEAAAAEEYKRLAGRDVPPFDRIKQVLTAKGKIYFVGIGGISMCGLAELSHDYGAVSSGSDIHENGRIDYLRSLGIKVYIGQEASDIDAEDPDLVVFSGAVFEDNQEILRARAKGITCVERSEFLGALTRLYPHTVNICGTNGKSTTTAMCALILLQAGLNPTVHLGAELIDFKTTVHLGGRSLFLSEACEFRRGFYNYCGDVAVILDIVHDHIDCYPTLADMIDAFATFLALQRDGTTVFLPADDPNLSKLLAALEKLSPGKKARLSLKYFGKKQASKAHEIPDFAYDDLCYDKSGNPNFKLYQHGEFIADIALSIPGEFNVQNALAAIAVAMFEGADIKAIKTALLKFQGAEGRFTKTGYYNGALVIVDYAHHPSAVKVTMEAAKHIPAKKLWICFQPLTHSRVRGFFADFVEVFRHEDLILMSEIYDDREKDTTISSKDICDAINQKGGNAIYFKTNADLEHYLRQVLEPSDVLLIMGVDLREVGDNLAERKSHFQKA